MEVVVAVSRGVEGQLGSATWLDKDRSSSRPLAAETRGRCFADKSHSDRTEYLTFNGNSTQFSKKQTGALILCIKLESNLGRIELTQKRVKHVSGKHLCPSGGGGGGFGSDQQGGEGEGAVHTGEEALGQQETEQEV